MAAYTAWRFVQGLSTPLGDGRDGSIWLPVTAHELRDTYAPLGVQAAKTALDELGAR